MLLSFLCLFGPFGPLYSEEKTQFSVHLSRKRGSATELERRHHTKMHLNKQPVNYFIIQSGICGLTAVTAAVHTVSRLAATAGNARGSGQKHTWAEGRTPEILSICSSVTLYFSLGSIKNTQTERIMWIFKHIHKLVPFHFNLLSRLNVSLLSKKQITSAVCALVTYEQNITTCMCTLGHMQLMETASTVYHRCSVII